MVGAWVIEVGADDKLTARGYFQFVQLPAPNDRLTLAGDLFGVILVEHAPAAVSSGERATVEPVASVYVHWLGERDAARRPGLVP